MVTSAQGNPPQRQTLTYRIELENRARKELLDLPKEITERIESAIIDLEQDPRPPGAKKLAAKNGYRIRKGDYRVLYTIDDSLHLIRIYRIGHRREIYR